MTSWPHRLSRLSRPTQIASACTAAFRSGIRAGTSHFAGNTHFPGHGRCGKRWHDAQHPEGLRERLRKTQEADPHDQRTSEDAIAHDWVRQHHPGEDLEPWQPVQESGSRQLTGNVQDLTADSAAFILTWHPEHFRWEEHGYHDAIQATAGGQVVADDCTVGNRKEGISPGDRAYLYRQHDDRGIVASGVFTSRVESRQHWDGSGRPARYADVDWGVVLDYEDCLPLEALTAEVPEMPWSHLQGSGIEVKPAAAPQLHELWERHTGKTFFRSPDELWTHGTETFPEGALSQIQVNRYERDPRARKACLERWGYRCAVCEISFEEIYGPLGREYIHVHHLKELSRLPADYRVNPVTDLRPVCPNCHAMIHRGTGPALAIEELKRQLQQNG